MKIGDIKLQALWLMYPEVPAYATGDTLKNFDLSDYSEILARMTGSMARCLDVIVEQRVLPVKRKDLYLVDSAGDGIKADKSGLVYRFDLEKVSDFFDVSRVIMVCDNAYDGDHPYRMEDKVLVLIAPEDHASFTLLYHPTVNVLSVWNNEGELDGIPDELARLIPYFIKGELFREDEPGEAAEAMSWFEQRLAAVGVKRTEKQSRVSSVYNMEAM